MLLLGMSGQKIYSIIALLPMTLGSYFGSFGSLEAAEAALAEHIKTDKDEMPDGIYFNIFSHELGEPLPVQFNWVKKITP